MTVPGRVEAAALLLSLDPPIWFLRHARAVAEVAGWLAARTAAASQNRVDSALVEAAALLHDADKLLADGDPARALPHGDGSAAWVARNGYPELGPAVACHPVTRLIDAYCYDRWAATASREERIVAYADKRAGQRLESMSDRFASWAQRYPGGWSPDEAAAARRRADDLEAEVCKAAGVVPSEVRRLSWTGAALSAARGRP
jgi:hypothetical protein